MGYLVQLKLDSGYAVIPTSRQERRVVYRRIATNR